MDCLDRELLWNCFTCLAAKQIMTVRRVSTWWKHVVDNVSQHTWKLLYQDRVCRNMHVGPSFDWKNAFARAACNDNIINVHCVWKSVNLYISPPWKDEPSIDIACMSDVTRNVRTGVRRQSVSNEAIDYQYGDIFTLRAIARTCRGRNSLTTCNNCLSKRRCLRLQYDYYLRRMIEHDERVDEHLSWCLAAR